MVDWLTGEFGTLLMMAVALGTDAFSMGIGLGLTGIRKLYILYISLMIGALHMAMPLIGLFVGRYLHNLIGNATEKIGALVLIALGFQMIYTIIRHHNSESGVLSTSISSMIIFSFSVSIDALPAGFGLGLFSTPIAVTVLMIGTTGLVMTACGLLLGRRLGPKFGNYGHLFGGLVLMGLGLSYLF